MTILRDSILKSTLGSTLQPAAAGGGAFSPLDLSPILWLDASDTDTITDAGGGKVSQWDDKSASGNNATQSTDADRYITGTRTINSLNGLDSDGSNDGMQLDSTINLTGDFSFFFTFNPDAVSDALFGLSTSNGTYFYLWTNGRLALQDTASFSGTATNLPSQIGINSMATFTRSGTSLDITKDNTTPETFSSHGSHTIQIDLIGTRGGVSNVFNGIIGEIIIYDSVITGSDLAAVQSYLSDKWGVA